MKTLSLLLLQTIVIFNFSCSRKSSDHPKDWNDKELSGWFNAGGWKSGWEIQPDNSVDQRELAVQYVNNRERWEKAFNFLNNTDLKNVPTGKYALDGDSLFATISEYMTKNEEEGRFEAHRKYADIQYLITGQEKMGIIPIGSTTETVPYDGNKDIVFLSSPQPNYHLASPDRFFIFFPNDAHCPGIRTDENMNVRKVVVKVLLK